jgi:hypothetical protein
VTKVVSKEAAGAPRPAAGERSKDQQAEEGRHIAESLVQILRSAGYSCSLAEDGDDGRASTRLS